MSYLASHYIPNRRRSLTPGRQFFQSALIISSNIRSVCCICVFALIAWSTVEAQKLDEDNFQGLVADLQNRISSARGGQLIQPSNEDLRQWSRGFRYFRAGILDSCRNILKNYNYTLLQLADHQTGSVYDIIREDAPTRRGWGTFIYNRHHTKRVFVHVTHPVDDAQVARIGADLFRSTQAEWLYVAGTRRNDRVNNTLLDPARARRSLFQHWHEMFADLTHVAISLHGFTNTSYSSRWVDKDIVVSNGKTSDDQWGISQISLSFRDSMRAGGFSCALAMYDSGFASLSWGASPQAMFSNDSAGFGHWLSIELSDGIRHSPTRRARFIAAADDALEITGRKISQQVNRAFGLVSPRSVRLNASHGMLFPPANADTYRIISFSSVDAKRDTLDIRAGSWLRFPRTSGDISSITGLDSSRDGIVQMFRTTGDAKTRLGVANLVSYNSSDLSSVLLVNEHARHDSSNALEIDEDLVEPLQTHRIRLNRRDISISHSGVTSEISPYQWRGAGDFDYSPAKTYLRFGGLASVAGEELDPPNLLIPLIHRSYRPEMSPYLGIQMTAVVVEQIARLVSEEQNRTSEIELFAEEAEDGHFYLRIFPSVPSKQIAVLEDIRSFPQIGSK